MRSASAIFWVYLAGAIAVISLFMVIGFAGR
jgi:hypothetical protein